MKKVVLFTLVAAAAIGCSDGSSHVSQSENDEYDRLYMANKEFSLCDSNRDGILSNEDVDGIKNNAAKRGCMALLDSRGGESIAEQEFVTNYRVPEIKISGERIANVVYKSIGDEKVMMDIYLPQEEYRPEGLMPVVLFFHGGGWRNGDKYMINSNGCQLIADRLLKQGIAVISTNYRFVIDGERFVPTVVSDAKDVVAFVNRDGESYGIDGDKVIVWGGSAGGHLSLMCGFTADDAFPGDADLSKWRQRPLGVVSWYGSGDFTLGSWDDAIARGHESFYRCFTTSKETEVIQAKGFESSPLEQITSDASPTVLFGGDADVIVSVNDAKKMYAKLQECGVESELIIVHGAGHGWSGKNFTPNKEQIDQLTYDAVLKLLGMKN